LDQESFAKAAATPTLTALNQGYADDGEKQALAHSLTPLPVQS